MQEEYGIKLKVFEALLDTPDDSIKKGIDIVTGLDTWTLTCLS